MKDYVTGLKQSLIEIHENKGVPYTFMARKCGISRSMLCLWLKGERNASGETLEKIERYIKENK